jgi:hypothetical protein
VIYIGDESSGVGYLDFELLLCHPFERVPQLFETGDLLPLGASVHRVSEAAYSKGGLALEKIGLTFRSEWELARPARKRWLFPLNTHRYGPGYT